jgi:flagellar basal-body rod modification protein FlgD
MGVTATNYITATNGVAAEALSRVPTQTLGQDDFLKLLIAQMTTQDPMNPMSNMDFIAQMAQFTSLEQTRAMSVTMTQMNQQQQLLQANGLIGREVTIKGAEGSSLSGVVSGVTMDGNTPLVVVNGLHYPLSAITSITGFTQASAQAPVAAPDPKSPTAPVPEPEPQPPVLSETSNS